MQVGVEAGRLAGSGEERANATSPSPTSYSSICNDLWVNKNDNGFRIRVQNVVISAYKFCPYCVSLQCRFFADQTILPRHVGVSI